MAFPIRLRANIWRGGYIDRCLYGRETDMAKYRKKSVVNEAEQWFPGKRVDGVQEIVHDDGTGTTSNGYGVCETIHGPVRVDPGDWIIIQTRPAGSGSQIDSYPCKADIFAQTYELEE